jgi:hypothetical protein
MIDLGHEPPLSVDGSEAAVAQLSSAGRFLLRSMVK